jgi:hypothetical protein
MNGHIEYCWTDPVKHGLVRRVANWPHSSFHRAVRDGVLPEDWAGMVPEGEFGEWDGLTHILQKPAAVISMRMPPAVPLAPRLA